jgi:putative ABC transport system substrate-binding protein
MGTGSQCLPIAREPENLTIPGHGGGPGRAPCAIRAHPVQPCLRLLQRVRPAFPKQWRDPAERAALLSSRAWRQNRARTVRDRAAEGRRSAILARGGPRALPNLAREVVGRNPDVIVAIGGPITQAISAATGTIPIVASGDTSLAVVPGLARPGGNITGVRVDVGWEIYGKRLQSFKEAVPSVSKVAFLDLRTFWESAAGQQVREELRKASQILEISLSDIPVEESNIVRISARIRRNRPGPAGRDHRQRHKRVGSVPAVDRRAGREKPLAGDVSLSSLGGGGRLMAYGTDLVELWRRLAAANSSGQTAPQL